MAGDTIKKYIWLVDTIMRHRFITRKELNSLWVKNIDLSGGNPMPRRTFYTYLRGIESTFDINIACNPATFEYSIEGGSDADGELRSWLLDSMAVSGSIADSRMVSHRIMFEDVPSAHEFLAIILQGVKENRRIQFEYTPFDRSGTAEVVLEPYFLRIFKQRWYVIGNEPKKNGIRTYSLDRFKRVRLLDATFKAPEFDVKEYFKDCVGIYHDKGSAKEVKLKVKHSQARYLRALPLHPSQQEEIHDKYSIFTYKILITFDLVQEILALGSNVEVVAPKSLQVKVVEELKNALKNYKSSI